MRDTPGKPSNLMLVPSCKWGTPMKVMKTLQFAPLSGTQSQDLEAYALRSIASHQ